MKNKKIKKKLYTIACLQAQLDTMKKEIEKDEALELEGADWKPEKIIRNCKITEKGLVDENGKLLSRSLYNYRVSGYFVNQSPGYCEDDYHGDIFYPVDEKGTYVKVSYECW